MTKLSNFHHQIFDNDDQSTKHCFVFQCFVAWSKFEFRQQQEPLATSFDFTSFSAWPFLVTLFVPSVFWLGFSPLLFMVRYIIECSIRVYQLFCKSISPIFTWNLIAM